VHGDAHLADDVAEVEDGANAKSPLGALDKEAMLTKHEEDDM